MCPEPAAPPDRSPVSGASPDEAFPAGLLDALRRDATASVARSRHVARARQRVAHVRLDDAELLEGIASSLLAASDDGGGARGVDGGVDGGVDRGVGGHGPAATAPA